MFSGMVQARQLTKYGFRYMNCLRDRYIFNPLLQILLIFKYSMIKKILNFPCKNVSPNNFVPYKESL
jgi:hypothetical protein